MYKAIGQRNYRSFQTLLTADNGLDDQFKLILAKTAFHTLVEDKPVQSALHNANPSISRCAKKNISDKKLKHALEACTRLFPGNTPIARMLTTAAIVKMELAGRNTKGHSATSPSAIYCQPAGDTNILYLGSPRANPSKAIKLVRL